MLKHIPDRVQTLVLSAKWVMKVAGDSDRGSHLASANCLFAGCKGNGQDVALYFTAGLADQAGSPLHADMYKMYSVVVSLWESRSQASSLCKSGMLRSGEAFWIGNSSTLLLQVDVSLPFGIGILVPWAPAFSDRGLSIGGSPSKKLSRLAGRFFYAHASS